MHSQTFNDKFPVAVLETVNTESLAKWLVTVSKTAGIAGTSNQHLCVTGVTRVYKNGIQKRQFTANPMPGLDEACPSHYYALQFNA